jgi:hypothetical protein
VKYHLIFLLDNPGQSLYSSRERRGMDSREGREREREREATRSIVFSHKCGQTGKCFFIFFYLTSTTYFYIEIQLVSWKLKYYPKFIDLLMLCVTPNLSHYSRIFFESPGALFE